MIVKETFDGYAVEYEEKFNRNPLGQYQREQVHLLLKRCLSGGQRILDAGCGPGSDFPFFAQCDVAVEALDISARMLDIARAQADRLHLPVVFHQGDFLRFSSEQHYDVILMNFGVINIFNDLKVVSQKIAALLNPAGVALVVSMPPLHLFSLAAKILQGRFADAVRRVIRQRAMLNNGLQIHYYRGKDFEKYFSVVDSLALGPLLPSPDQYLSSTFCRRYTARLQNVDRKLAGRLPDWMGGDHVCYVLRPIAS